MNERADVWDMVHVVTRLELGGAQLATLFEVGHAVFPEGERFLLFGPGGLLDEEARKQTAFACVEVPSLIRSLSLAKDLQAVRQVWTFVRSRRRAYPNRRLLVHTHSSKAGIVGRWGAFLGRADCIVHSVHGWGHTHHPRTLVRWLLLLAERMTAWITDGFTADSAANLVQGRKERILGRKPCRVVRCGIDVERFARSQRSGDEVRRQLEIPTGDTLILNLSCLKPQKDPVAYVRLAHQVVRERPNVTFLLAGDGELRAKVEQAREKHGLGPRLRILGWRRDVPELLGASDILVLTSRWEGLPQAFAQAMAAGLPIVATRVDGGPEAVVDGQNGFLFPPGDMAGMAQAIVRLVDDAKLRERLGEEGRRRVEAFSHAAMLAELDGFYEELTARARLWRRVRAFKEEDAHV